MDAVIIFLAYAIFSSVQQITVDFNGSLLMVLELIAMIRPKVLPIHLVENAHFQ